jgi:hypothetical protein
MLAFAHETTHAYFKGFLLVAKVEIVIHGKM